MDFITPFTPEAINWIFNLMALLVFILVIVRINWIEKKQAGILNIWSFAVFFIAILWMMRASLHSGLNLHFSGAMLMALMFGWRLGVLAMSLICVLVSLWGHSSPWNLGISFFVYAYFSVSFSYLFFLIIEAYLPRNLFIYLFATSFFGAAINLFVTCTVSLYLLGWQEIFSWSVLYNEYMPFYFLMSFVEAFITCGIITMLVVYKPEWVYSFRDERYLNGK